MIFLYSSSLRPVYRQTVLDSCCYPEHHVIRLRYSEAYVHPAIYSNPTSIANSEALLVFASTPKSTVSEVPLNEQPSSPNDQNASKSEPAQPQGPEFSFIPTRSCKIMSAKVESSVLLVDVELGQFVNYGIGDEVRKRVQSKLLSHTHRPHPQGKWPEGYFIYQDEPIEWEASSSEGISWRSLVDKINSSELSESLTYRIVGFFKKDGNVITASTQNSSCVYSFPPNETVELRIFYYHKVDQSPHNWRLDFDYDCRVIASSSANTFRVLGRYDEGRFLLSTTRITDPTYGHFSIVPIVESAHPERWAAKPSFTLVSRPKTSFLLMVVAFFAFGLMLLNLSVADLATLAPPDLAKAWWFRPICGWMLKVAGFLAVATASYQYLRKFPLK